MTPSSERAQPARTADILPRRGQDAARLRELLHEQRVRYLRLQFTDVLGTAKQIDVTERQFDAALAGAIMFDGSSIAGVAPVEESDMLLKPDLDTLRLLPWDAPGGGRTAHLICDVQRPDGTPFEGDPRGTLKRVLGELAELGYRARIGLEMKFYLFAPAETGLPVPYDRGGYFDAAPADRGELVRHEIVEALDALGLSVEAAHHEIGPGQHEIDFAYDDALATADHATLFKQAVRRTAHRHGLRATFMPKPFAAENGSGLHVHHSLERDGANAFFDPDAAHGLSDVARHYVGGLLRHARGFCAVTNPLVNSYKRLVPGYEAPVRVAWALQNRSTLIRVPAPRGEATRVELRMPDPAANPYLALAVQIAAGIDGLRHEIDPGEPIHKDVWTMSARERSRLGIQELPRHLGEALDRLEEDRVVRAALGEHVYAHFLETKRREWREYIAVVHRWEIDRYLDT